MINKTWRRVWLAICCALWSLGLGSDALARDYKVLLNATPPKPGVWWPLEQGGGWWITRWSVPQKFSAAGRVIDQKTKLPAYLHFATLPGVGVLAFSDTELHVLDANLAVIDRIAYPQQAVLTPEQLESAVALGRHVTVRHTLGWVVFDLERKTSRLVPSVEPSPLISALSYVLPTAQGLRLVHVGVEASNDALQSLVVTLHDFEGVKRKQYKYQLTRVSGCSPQLPVSPQGAGAAAYLSLICTLDPGEVISYALGEQAAARRTALAAFAEIDPKAVVRDVWHWLGTPWTPAPEAWVNVPNLGIVQQQAQGVVVARLASGGGPKRRIASSARVQAQGSELLVYSEQGLDFYRVDHDATLTPVASVPASFSPAHFAEQRDDQLAIYFSDGQRLRLQGRDFLGVETLTPMTAGADSSVSNAVVREQPRDAKRNVVPGMAWMLHSMSGFVRDGLNFKGMAKLSELQVLAPASDPTNPPGLAASGQRLFMQTGPYRLDPVGRTAAKSDRELGNFLELIAPHFPGTALRVGSSMLRLDDYLNPLLGAFFDNQVLSHTNVEVIGQVVYSLASSDGQVLWRNLAHGSSGAYDLGGVAAILQWQGQLLALDIRHQMWRLAGERWQSLGTVPQFQRLMMDHGRPVLLGQAAWTLNPNFQLERIKVPEQARYLSAVGEQQWVWIEGNQLKLGARAVDIAAGARGVVAHAGLIVVPFFNGRVEFYDAQLQLLCTLIKTDHAHVMLTPEGYFQGDGALLQRLSLVEYEGAAVVADHPISSFFDIFHRPDIVQAKLRGEDIRPLIGDLTLERALSSPPPKVALGLVPKVTALPQLKVPYTITPDRGGIAEVRVFQNGKLIASDGTYKDARGRVLAPVAAKVDEAVRYVQNERQRNAVALDGLKSLGTVTTGPTSLPAGVRDQLIVRGAPEKTCNPCEGEIVLDVIPGEENTLTVVAFNRDNTIQSAPTSVTFQSSLPKAEPQLWLLGVGIDAYQGLSPLRNARKDAVDFVCSYAGAKPLRALGVACSDEGKAQTLFKPDRIRVLPTLLDAQASKAKIMSALQQVAREAQPQDTFVWFVASHGLMDGNGLFGIVAHDTKCLDPQCTQVQGHITSNEILEASKRIKAMKQWVVLDTCHSGGLDSKLSGLYDARVSLLAKNMGLHLFASAQATEAAQDGAPGTNGTFTAQLLAGIRGAAPRNVEQQISVMSLGAWARQQTIMQTSTKDGARSGRAAQTPVIQHVGQDVGLVR